MSVKTIMTADESGEELVTFARETAIRLANKNLKRNQIRNIFTEVRQIEALWEIDKTKAVRRLNMLKPKMAYQSDRHKEVSYLESVLSEAITEVMNAQKESEEKMDQAFKRFTDLFEAILAYHRAEGGKN